MQKLPKKFKAKWIKALLSDDFLQAAGKLLSNDPIQVKKPECCCIGVAALVCGLPKNLIRNTSFLQKLEFSKFQMKKINKKVPKLLIGSNNELNSDYNAVITKLAAFNDGGKSFKWIAAYIKRYL